MNKNFYSNIEFTELKERLNREIKRRSTFRWADPLSTPTVGTDKSSPLSIPDIGDRVLVNDKTYTVNNPSEGSLERTRNINYPAQGENPGGQNPDRKSSVPNTSAAQINVDEMKNMLIGLAKMQDINLFYGRDEIEHLAFRDPSGIEDALVAAENSLLNKPLAKSDCSPVKNDPNGGITNYQSDNYPNEKYNVAYPVDEEGNYIMPSGEFDGEEVKTYEGLGPTNFYDDYGAKPGDSNFHPYNRFISEVVNRDWHDQDNDRNTVVTKVTEGGISSKRFGVNPRNPQQGNEYRSRPVYGGVISNCNNLCVGLCYITCDNECSESCTTTCWNRCGEACTASCGNVCTGCSTMCYSSCKTKCENSTGYSCVKAGAKAVKITSTGGKNGVPAENKLNVTTYSCTGCSYSCQFYPNKKTECWDSGCMGKCFVSCTNSCSTSCYGGCINNDPQPGDTYKTGKGRGCDTGCTLNCIGLCQGVCEGYCVQTCWHACKQKCSDNCFIAGTLVETDKGPIEIEQLQIGDLVLTGDGTYQPVLRTFKRSPDVNELMTLRATGSFPIKTTSEHPFWVRRNTGKGTTRLTNSKMLYSEPEWIETKDIHQKDKICLFTPSFGTVHIDEGVAYFVGRWLGDGTLHVKTGNRYKKPEEVFLICCGHHEELIFDDKLQEYGILASKSYTPTTISYRLNTGTYNTLINSKNQELYKILKTCGRFSHGKHLPSLIREWDKESIISLLKGYIDADGHIRSTRNSIIISSISKKLIYQVSVLLRMLGRNPSIYVKEYSSNTGTILGRNVNLHNVYTLEFSLNNSSNVSTKYGINNDNCVWGTVHSIIQSDELYDVYNIEVGGNHTYYADGILVHNCSWKCTTNCGQGCANTCKQSCTSCFGDCISNCTGQAKNSTCDGCTSACKSDCNSNCMGKGCRSVCGTEGSSACEANCRLNCSASSCTSMCEDACSGRCSTCVNSCGWQCGACVSSCSSGCSQECNVTCSAACEHSCDTNCVHSCTEECGGCSNLCYSCVGMCIGVCSVKCENGCSSCANNCGWWCDSTCHQSCFASCDNMCIQTCMGSCATYLESKTTMTEGPDRDPTSQGYIYPHPKNRWEERESFINTRDIPNTVVNEEEEPPLIFITLDELRNLSIQCPSELIYVIKQTTISGGVFTIDESTGKIIINEDMLPGIINVMQPNIDNGGSIYIIIFRYNDSIQFTDDDIRSELPFGFEQHPLIVDKNKNNILIIQRDEFLYPVKGEEEIWQN